MTKRKYEWKIGGPLPTLDWHSVAKHKVLRDYLRLYVQVLTKNPRRDRLTLTLVDGFCGGGVYHDRSGEARQGSPLILLEAMQEAAVIASATRTKPFCLDAEYYFIDEDPAAIAHLEHALHQHPLPRDRVQLLAGAFRDHVPSLIARIKQRGTANRCIFVLDQYGYMDAPMGTIRRIFSQLPHAEV